MQKQPGPPGVADFYSLHSFLFLRQPLSRCFPDEGVDAEILNDLFQAALAFQFSILKLMWQNCIKSKTFQFVTELRAKCLYRWTYQGKKLKE